MAFSILLGYATRYGSTKEAADVVAATLQEAGFQVDLQPAREVKSLVGYGAVVLGAPLTIDADAFKTASGDLEGSLRLICEKVHAYGGKVISTVTTVEHALAAQKSGADALQVTGFEAAAHGSQVTTLVLVPTVVDAVKIPVVAIGGIADGRGMAAAFALGAEGVGMGTRLSITKESPVHQLAMQKQLELGAEDTIYSNRFDALYCRVLKTPSAEKAVKQGRNLAKGLAASFDIAKSLDLSWMKLATSILGGSKKDKSGKPKEADTAPKQKKGEISLFQKMMKYL